MTIEFTDDIYNEQYLKKRQVLSLYYCFKAFDWYDKGMYICEEINDELVRVFFSVKGKIISKEFFNKHFKKPSKLRLFLYKYFV